MIKRTAAMTALLFSLTTGCDAVPDLTFDGADAGANDATSPPLQFDASASGLDATVPGSPTPAGDATTPRIPDSSDAADAADAADALACLPPNAPPGAACCYDVLPCVGQACADCAACIAQGCHANQFCCVQMGGMMMGKGVQCSGDGKNCM